MIVIGIVLILMGTVFEADKRLHPQDKLPNDLRFHISNFGWLWITLGAILIIVGAATEL